MNYRVHWHHDVLADLPKLYLLAKEEGCANEFALASHQIDVMLAKAPFDCSESRDGETCVFFALPLSVYFIVDEELRIVHLKQLRSCGPPKR
jgi:hypothetical protein